MAHELGITWPRAASIVIATVVIYAVLVLYVSAALRQLWWK